MLEMATHSLHEADRPDGMAACWESFLSNDDIETLLRQAYTLVRQPGGGCTHYISDHDVPECFLEAFALAVVKWHMARLSVHLGSDPTFGAEFWVQVRDPDEPLATHWDCDEYLKSDTGEHIPPFLASVTYLTSDGAPTAVLPVAADKDGAAIPQGNTAFTSFPIRGKHLCFDGRLLHGAPYDGPEDSCGSPDQHADHERRLRATILVNLWINHRPRRVDRLPADIVTALRAESAAVHDSHPWLIAVAACAVAARPLRVPPPDPHADPSLERPWREFPIGSFHHHPVRLRPLSDLWTRPIPNAHFLEYQGVELDALAARHKSTMAA